MFRKMLREEFTQKTAVIQRMYNSLKLNRYYFIAKELKYDTHRMEQKMR